MSATAAIAAMIGILESSASQFVTDVTQIRPSLTPAHHFNRIQPDAAASVMTTRDTQEFIEQLPPDQVRALQAVLAGPVFRQLIRQTVIAATGADSPQIRANISNQVYWALQLSGWFVNVDLYQTTNAIVELLDMAVTAALQSCAPDIRSHTVALFADIATAGRRNAELLQRITSLNAVNNFANGLRESVAALHTRIRLNQSSNPRLASYPDLYVRPNSRTSSAAAGVSSDIATMVSTNMRTVVLGDPGAGKSTFAAKLAFDLASDRIAGWQSMVPLLLIVRQHTKSLRYDHDTLLSYLAASCRRPYQLDPPPDALDYLLLNGRAVVIIDGVDELGNSEFRTSFVQMVNGFVHRYPLTSILVTSRLVGYLEAPLDPALFQVIEMAPFSTQQVSAYARNWFRLDQTLSEDDRREYSESFMRESEVASDLRANPLMLSLLCGLYSSTHFIPRNRPEIYERCAELLFEIWDRSRGIDVPHRFDAQIRPAVQRMAWQLFTDRNGRQALPRSELRRDLANYLQGRRFDADEDALQAADDFLRFCTGRAWVLTDVGSDTMEPHYGFVHRTFLEFFAAAQLVKAKPDPATVWAKLRQHVDESTWALVGLMAVQLLDRSHDNGADLLLRHALMDANDPHWSSARLNILHFAARCLDVVSPSNTVVREVVGACISGACEVRPADRRTIGRDEIPFIDGDRPLLELLAIAAPDNRQRVVDAVADAITGSAQNYSADSAAGIIFATLSDLDPTGTPLSRTAQLIMDELRMRQSPPAATHPPPAPADRGGS